MKTWHLKCVTFSRRKYSYGKTYAWIRVYFDGLHVGNIDWLDAGQGREQGWSANKKLRERYGDDFCEELPLDKAKRIVKRAILDRVLRVLEIKP